MAQLNITLNQEEILQLISENSGEAFKKLLQDSLNSVLKAESASQLQAERYERTEGRTDSRKGHHKTNNNTNQHNNPLFLYHNNSPTGLTLGCC